MHQTIFSQFLLFLRGWRSGVPGGKLPPPPPPPYRWNLMHHHATRGKIWNYNCVSTGSSELQLWFEIEVYKLVSFPWSVLSQDFPDMQMYGSLIPSTTWWQTTKLSVNPPLWNPGSAPAFSPYCFLHYVLFAIFITRIHSPLPFFWTFGLSYTLWFWLHIHVTTITSGAVALIGPFEKEIETFYPTCSYHIT